MNRGSIVEYVGEEVSNIFRTNFIVGRKYRVKAGIGDGVPRNNGTLGAKIIDQNIFVVVDESGNYIIQSMKGGKWKLVEEAKATSWVKSEKPSPVYREKRDIPADAMVENGEFSASDAC